MHHLGSLIGRGWETWWWLWVIAERTIGNQVGYLPTNDSNSINDWRDIYPTWGTCHNFGCQPRPSWIGSGFFPRMGLKVLIDRSMVCRMWWMIPEAWWSANSDLAGIWFGWVPPATPSGVGIGLGCAFASKDSKPLKVTKATTNVWLVELGAQVSWKLHRWYIFACFNHVFQAELQPIEIYLVMLTNHESISNLLFMQGPLEKVGDHFCEVMFRHICTVGTVARKGMETPIWFSRLDRLVRRLGLGTTCPHMSTLLQKTNIDT